MVDYRVCEHCTASVRVHTLTNAQHVLAAYVQRVRRRLCVWCSTRSTVLEQDRSSQRRQHRSPLVVTERSHQVRFTSDITAWLFRKVLNLAPFSSPTTWNLLGKC